MASGGQRERARWEEGLDALPELLYVRDGEGRVLWASAALGRMFGREPDNLSWESLFEPEHRPRLRRHLNTVAAGRRPGPLEVLGVHASGRHLWLEVVESPIDKGRVAGSIRDISDRRTAEGRMILEANWLDRLTAGLAEAILVVDDAGFVRHAAGGTEQVLERPPHALRGMRFLELVAAADRDHVERWLEDPATAGLVRHGIVTPGHEVPVESALRDLRQDTIVRGLVITVRDRRRSERDAAALLALQQLSTRLVDCDDFEGAVGHVLHVVQEVAGWPYAEAWVRRDKTAERVGPALDHLDDGGRFRACDPGAHIRRGQGPIGLAFVTASTIHATDLPGSLTLGRATAAGEAGLTEALAVPVMNDGQAIAVLAFFAREPIEEAHRGLAEAAATQAAGSLHRLQVESRLRFRTRVLEAQMEALPDPVLVLADDGRVLAANGAALDLAGTRLRPISGDPGAWLGTDIDARVIEPRALRELAVLAQGDDGPCRVFGVDFLRTNWPIEDDDGFVAAKVILLQEVEEPDDAPPLEPVEG